MECVGEKRKVCKFVVGRSEESDHCEDLDIDGQLILLWILYTYIICWTELTWLKIGTRDWLLW